MRLVPKGLLLVGVLALLLLAAPSASANPCVSNATGNWSAAGTWTACGGVIPTSADTVEINGGRTVTVDVSTAVAASIQLGGNPGTLAGTIAFNSGSKVTVSGALTLGGATSTTHATVTMTSGGTLSVGSVVLGTGTNTKTFTTGTGTVELTATNTLPPGPLSFNNLIITAGTTTLAETLTINGSLTQSGGNIAVGTWTLTINGTHNAGTNTVSGAGIYVLANAATLLSGHTDGVAGNITTTTQSLSTVANYSFNGTSAQVTSTTMPATVNNLTINNAAGVTLTRNTATSGTLIVTAGTFTVGAFTYSVTGLTTLSGTLAVTSATGTKTFTGKVTINNGGSWNETANAAISFGGGLQNDGTFTASTGIHTFNGAARIISGANAIDIPSLTVSGTTTNNGTLTVSTTLAGTSTLTNGTNATLNFGGSSITPTLTAIATPNLVNYTLAGAQTVKATTYHNLTLSGSGLKTTTTVTVDGILSMQGTATAGAAPTYGATSTLEYKGSAAQIEGPELLATMAAGRTVVINNAAGLTLTSDTTVNGAFTFTIGNVTTGAFTLYIGSGGNVSRTSGHVVGNFKKFIATGATSKTFESGGPTNYTPVLVSFASVTTAGDLTASVVSGDHANIGTSTIVPTASVNRNWTLTNSGIVFTSYDATFTFVAGDVDESANTNAFIVGKYSAGWSYPTVGTKTATTTQATGLTSFSDFQLGELAATYTISGHIQNGNAAAISGVTLTLSGGQAGTTTTNASGNYSFAALPSSNNYTITPSLTNYTFSPASLTYNALSANQTAADFSATSISGQAPALGAAASFAVLGATTVTNTGLTVVSGNVGVSPGTAVTGFPPGVIQNGQIYSGGGSLAGPAQADAATAYNNLVAQPCVPANNLSGKVLGVTPGAVTLVPGVYCFDTSAQLTTNLTLDEGGDPNAIFIFKVGTTITTASSSQVLMSSSGRGTNVYWQIGTSATIGTGTIFRGNIIASTSITMTTGASTTGRLFAIGAAVTMDTNNVDVVQTSPVFYFSGTVFEDKNFGGGDGRSLISSSGVARAGARVELYDSGGMYQTFTPTDGSGNYTFSGLAAGTYTVRVVNGSVTTSRGVLTTTTPTQTFRTDASSGAAVAVTDHVGGETPGLLDAVDGSTTLAALTTGTFTAQSITSVALSSGNISGVDFGYSFNVIVNKNNSGQGSLRRVLIYANAMSNTGLAQSGLTAGIDNAVFMLADGTARPGLTASYPSQFVSGVATVNLTSVLATISDPIILDATLQPGYASVPMIELNGAGAGGGVSGLTITAGGSTVRGLIINRFSVDGISLSTSGNNTIAANYIGTNATGTSPAANSNAGIKTSSAGNTIGGTTIAAGNLISGNGKGVIVTTGTGNAILFNSIYGNTGIGIDLTDDGVTVNDGTKSGALANFDMDTPVFSTTVLVGTTLTVTGYVGSAASQALFAGASVQVFKSDSDASGFGEGQTYLGTLIADPSGNFSGTVTVSLAVGDKITATATDASNNTSEFGANATVANPPPSIAHVSSVLPSGTQPPGTDLVYNTTFTNSGGQPAQVFIVVDPIPAHTDFKLGSASTVLATTGMTVAVEFSNDNAATWTYTPVSGGGGALAGYDRAVTHVRWRFTGNLSQTSPNNAGSVTLTTRIQ